MTASRVERGAALTAHRRSVPLSTALCAALLCAVLPACGPEGDAEAPRVIDVDELPPLVAEAGTRIGSFDDPDAGFTRIGSVDIDGDGNLYVVESTVPEIRVFDPEGTLLRTFGRRGEGPGEFESAPRIGVRGDTVWALEGWQRRITLFGRDGTTLSTHRIDDVRVPLPSGFGHVLPATVRADGKFVGHLNAVSFNRDAGPTGVEPTDSIPVPFVLFDAEGTALDTVGWAPRPPPRMWRPPSEDDTEMDFVEVGGRRQLVPRPPSRLPWWQALADGYVVIDTPVPEGVDDATFTVTRIGLVGDTVFHRVLRYRPVPYTPSDLDSIAARAARGEPGGGVPYSPNRTSIPDDWETTANVLRRAMDFPEFKLPIEYPRVGEDGSIWLREATEDDAPARWILLDADGRPRGRLELPPDLQIRWSEGDVFWAADPDEYDVPWLVRYTVQHSY